MIYTVTLNPSLDYVVEVDNFELTELNRTTSEQIFPGGKGINVSIVLNNLNIQSTSLGFVSGFTGKEIEARLEKIGCFTDFIHLRQGMSRINVKLKSNGETEINGQGPNIHTSNLEDLFEQLDKLVEGDILILAGSVPSSLPSTIYQDIMQRLSSKNIMIVVDATKDLLLNVLPHKPFLIKPNKEELGELFGVTLNDKADIKKYAKQLQQKGARNVLVSLSQDGAILISEDGKEYEHQAPKGKVINSVGAGDSMVAGFIAGYLDKKDYSHAFRMGIAAGSASAFSELLATREEIEKIYRTL